MGIVIVVASCGIFLAIQQYFDAMEHELINSSLEQRMEQFIEDYNQHHPMLIPNNSGFIGYISNSPLSPHPPTQLQPLTVGMIHDDIVIGHDVYHLLHRVHDGHSFYLLLDDTPIEKVKHQALYLVSLSICLALVTAILLAYWLARLISQPLSNLTKAVQAIDPTNNHHPPLSPHFRDHEVAAIAQAIDGFLERINDFILRERAFTEDASHELRTPVTVMQSTLDLFAEDTSLSPSTRQRLARLRRATDGMQELINPLLWLSREDSIRQMPQHDLAALVTCAVNNHRELLSKPIVLSLHDNQQYPRSVASGLASSVINNLLTNAIQHTAQGRIDVYLSDHELIVADTGTGIPAEDIAHIFERRYRGNNSRGHGLGLYLVKQMSIRLGWQIEVESTMGIGTRFVIKL